MDYLLIFMGGSKSMKEIVILVVISMEWMVVELIFGIMLGWVRWYEGI